MSAATRLTAGGAVVALLAAGGLATAHAVDQRSGSGAESAGAAETDGDGAGEQPDAAAGLGTDVVSRRTLEQVEERPGTLGHGEPFPLPGVASGTVTWVPERGTVLRPGDLLYRADERPAYWARGDVPMYRELAWGAKGADVEQLQAFLRDGGYLGADRVDGTFGRATARAVRAWQKDRGLERTGVVDASQLVVLPYDGLRVTSAPRVGEPAAGGVLEVSEPEVVVTLQVDPRTKRLLDSDPVIEVETADGQRLPATVAATSAQPPSDDGGRSFQVRLAVEGGEDVEPDEVEVDITEVLAEDVTAVPVRALVALADGRYAVQVRRAGGTSYVPVEPGEFAEGYVEVSGDVADGDEVVVAQ